MRQFIASEQLQANGLLFLSEKDVRYLKTVLRLKPHESISVRLIDGQILEMTLVKQKTAWVLEAIQGAKSKEKGFSVQTLEAQNLEIVLLQAMTKPHKMDLIIRQATECGVKTIVPIKGDLSQPYSFETKQERWKKIIKEARQQSGSPVGTELQQAMRFSEYVANYTEKSEFFLGKDENQEKKLVFKCYLAENMKTDSVYSLLLKNGEPKKILVAVGCEGGLSKKEVETLEENGFYPLHLSTNILRSETAVLYGIAVIQNAVMEYNIWQKQE